MNSWGEIDSADDTIDCVEIWQNSSMHTDNNVVSITRDVVFHSTIDGAFYGDGGIKLWSVIATGSGILVWAETLIRGRLVRASGNNIVFYNYHLCLLSTKQIFLFRSGHRKRTTVVKTRSFGRMHA